ncbi:hypothetical protein MD484_g8634, partial [Candolleomyces efflorescens]
MSELLQIAETIDLTDEDGRISLKGLLKLTPGDYLWTRNEFGSRKPEHDALISWRVGRHLRSTERMDALDNARDKFMGPEEDITEDSVLFERLDPKPIPVKKDTRCWTLGYSLEPNTNIEAPCANNKGIGGATAYHDTAQAVVTASTDCAMEDMEHAPDAIKKVLKSEFERHGMAPLGSSNNWAYHAGGYDHVGTPPYPLEGTLASPTAYRFALIHYTPQRSAAAETRLRIGALPTTHAFVSPEMRSAKIEGELLKRLQGDPFANFIRDGIYLMEDEAFVSYVGRMVYLLNRYLLLQAHTKFAFELDPEMLARSITYVTADGARKSVVPWTMAPPLQEGGGGDGRQGEREQSEKNFKEHVFKHGSMIPFCFMHTDWIKDEVERRYGRVVRVDRSGEGVVGARSSGLMHGGGTDQGGDAGAVAKRRKVVLPRETEDTDNMDAFEENTMKGMDLRYRQRSRKAPKQEESFRFLRALTVDTLEHEVLELRNELLADERRQSSEDLEGDVDDIKDCVDGANNVIEMGGIGKRVVAGIGTIMGDAPRLSNHLRMEGSKIREVRRTLIKAQTAIRVWIEGAVAEEAHSTAQMRRVSGGRRSWVAELTNSIVDMLVNRRSSCVFQASKYGLEWECEDIEIQNPHTRSLMVRGQEDTTREAVAMTVAVVEGWIEVDKLCDRKQAWFASTVEEVLGEEALLMNVTWQLYSNVKSADIFEGDVGYRKPSKKHLQAFRTALEGHSILDVDHREGKLFEIYKQLCSGELLPGDVLKRLPSVSARWTAIQDMLHDSSLYDNDSTPSNPTPYFKKLQLNPNAYHPLRERVPGRVRSRQDLFDGDQALSLEAVFSVVAWRAFPQVFSWHPDSTMLFSSPQDFVDAYARIVKSQPSDGVVKAVNRYWRMLKDERKWERLANTYPTFEDCYRYFKPPGSLENSLYPKLSKTNAFDVACDLAYACCCQPPTTADVARHIVQMNGGAMAALKSLGLVDGKKKDIDAKRSQVLQALLDIGELLIEIPEYTAYEDESELDEYGGEVDPMGVEHLLRTLSLSMRLRSS